MAKSKKQSINKDESQSNILTYLKSLVLFYFLMQLQHGLDHNILNHVHEIDNDKFHFSDTFRMPLAPHRFNTDPQTFRQHYWFFHMTHLSMGGFLEFVETKSTQVKTDHDFHMDFPYNRSASEGNLVPKEEWVQFKPEKSYGRSVVRRFLYEYVSKQVSWSRRN